MRVSKADSMATKVVKGNFFQGFIGKQSDIKSLKESGNTCMYPVARITPDANAFITTNKSLSGLSAGIVRENNGKHTPIILATKIEKMAISFSCKDLASSWHPPVEAESHCCRADVDAGNVNKRIKIREVVIALISVKDAMLML
jgi:hypothetical protein